jgi:hypothetical protein
MLRSIETKSRFKETPRCARACTVNFIMISGPTMKATVCDASKSVREIRVVTGPTDPCQPGGR